VSDELKGKGAIDERKELYRPTVIETEADWGRLKDGGPAKGRDRTLRSA